jgi:tRNA (uracil-5-)-methyltransferase TRM9
LFKKGELDGLFEQVENVVVESSGYDRDNHYVIGIKQ